MIDSIKITNLTNIGTNVSYNTLFPLVSMVGTPVTQKGNLQIIGNLILNSAGGSYFPPAAQSILAQSVTNAAQPNITSTGTLTSLTVSGNTSFGDIKLNMNNISTTSNLLLTTNSNSVSPKSWSFGNDGNTTFPITGSANLGNSVSANYFIGDGRNISYQQTNTYYVDPGRTQNYVPIGTQIQPFFSITAAISAATAAGYSDTNPAFIILMENITENITLKPGIWLTSLGTGTHGAPVLTGTVTISSTTGTTVSNHYAISNLRIVAPANGHCILFTGTAPQKMFIRDMWLDANGTGSGIYMDNTGAESTLHMDIAHLTHSGTGNVYSINVVKGSCYITNVETSGSVQFASIQSGAAMTIDGSELDVTGNVVCETYGTGILTITNSIVTNTQTNGNGIKINSSGSIVTIGNCLFSIPSGTGYVVSYNSSASLFGSTFAFSAITFLPNTNNKIDTRLLQIPLSILSGTITNPIFSGNLTSVTPGSWNLTDNVSTSLSFDTVGKTGILTFNTTNGTEGVTMSGYANISGNITSNNITANGSIGIGTAIPDAKLNILANTQTISYPVTGNSTASGTNLHVSGADGTITRVTQDAFGTGTYAAFTGRNSRGNAIAPTQTLTNDILTQFTGRGFSNGTLQFGNSSTGRIDVVAAENFTDTSRSTNVLVYTTSVGNIAPTAIATFSSASGLTVSGNITGGNIIGGNLIGRILAGSNSITTTGNITGGNIIGIIAAGANSITTTGNITGGNIIGRLANGNSNINIATANGNVIIAAVGNSTMTITGTGANIIGTANITGNVAVSNVAATGLVKTGVYVTGTIPTAVTAGAGARAFVTDATLTTFAAVYVGGAANAVPVYSDGTNWRIG